MPNAQITPPQAPSLPKEGFVRIPQILSVIPISRSGWLARVKEGTYPPPVKLGPRTTAWRVEDIRDLIEKLVQQAQDA